MKTLTDFRKTVETGVDPRLYIYIIINRFYCSMKKAKNPA